MLGDIESASGGGGGAGQTGPARATGTAGSEPMFLSGCMGVPLDPTLGEERLRLAATAPGLLGQVSNCDIQSPRGGRDSVSAG